MRILVVDDHSLFRDGLTSLLKAAGYEIIGEAGNGETAVLEALRLRPDLILMDINMPKKDGLQALREIHQLMPETNIVMLTVSETEGNLISAIEAGAKGYLLKNLDSQSFITNLRNLERGEAAITNEMVSHLMAHISRRAKQSSGLALNPKINLTEREHEILQLISKGLSNRAIAGKLIISENTVKYHIKNLLQKLSLKNRAEAAAYAIQQGGKLE